MTPSVMVTRQETSRRSVLPRLAGAVVWPPRFCPASALCSKLPEYKDSGSLWMSQQSVEVTMLKWKSLRGTKLIFTNWSGLFSSVLQIKNEALFLWGFYRTALRWSRVLWLWPMRGLSPRMQSDQFLQCPDVYAANLRFYSDAFSLRERIGRANPDNPSICTKLECLSSRTKVQVQVPRFHPRHPLHPHRWQHQRPSQPEQIPRCHVEIMCHVYHCLWFIWRPFVH